MQRRARPEIDPWRQDVRLGLWLKRRTPVLPRQNNFVPRLSLDPGDREISWSIARHGDGLGFRPSSRRRFAQLQPWRARRKGDNSLRPTLYKFRAPCNEECQRQDCDDRFFHFESFPSILEIVILVPRCRSRMKRTASMTSVKVRGVGAQSLLSTFLPTLNSPSGAS